MIQQKNEQAKIKAIHTTLRIAGYERQKRKWMVGPKLYECISCRDYWHIKIPGNWSIGLREKLRKELAEILKDFSPRPSIHDAGVDISR
jgi:hypothetical protein